MAVVLFLGIITTLSCVKEKSEVSGQQEPAFNQLTRSGYDAMGAETYLLSVHVGHRGSNCPGCIMYFGKLVHIDCQGNGNYCATAAAVKLQQVGADLVATTVDTFGLTSEDFFNMPARSLNYVDEDNNRVFLNIPAQLVYRDTATLQFSFTGLSITSGPLYEND